MVQTAKHLETEKTASYRRRVTTMDLDAATSQHSCRHHWVIEMPNGPVSHGQCKVCGMERDFHNNPEDARVGESQPVAGAA
jgi:hypothetical protein